MEDEAGEDTQKKLNRRPLYVGALVGAGLVMGIYGVVVGVGRIAPVQHFGGLVVQAVKNGLGVSHKDQQAQLIIPLTRSDKEGVPPSARREGQGASPHLSRTVPSSQPKASAEIELPEGEKAGVAGKNYLEVPTVPAPSAVSPASRRDIPNLTCSFSDVYAPTRAVVINELAWMGTPVRDGLTGSTAANREWIELKNVSASSLAGWQLLDSGEKIKVIFSETDRFSHGIFFILERTSDDTLPEITADRVYTGSLSNSGLWLRLFNNRCEMIDELDASHGWPGGDVEKKMTLERNSDFSGWHTSSVVGGTPNKENSSPTGGPHIAPSSSPPSTGLASSSSPISPSASPPPSDRPYTLSISFSGSGSGTVTSDSGEIRCTAACSKNFSSGSFLVLTGAPADGSLFSGWSGACSGKNSCSITVGKDSSLVANFDLPLPPPSPPILPPPPSPPSPSTGSRAHIVIKEVQITGGSGDADHDFIRLHNPTDGAVDISGWKLRRKTQSGTESSIRVLPDGSSIAAKADFTWANSGEGFADSIGAQAASTAILTNNNSIALLALDGAIVDALAWGSGHTNPFIEGSPYPENPGAGETLKRKGGGLEDTDNNANDFAL